MNDAGLHHIVRTILDAKTQGDAETYIAANVGKDYAAFAREILARVTYHRTTNQNAILHQWFGQIAKHKGDMTASEVKGECHQRWALPIRLRDEVFAWTWKQTGAKLPYEKQCKYLASEALTISSAMTTKELSEYMGEIEGHYRPAGVPLVQPKDAA